MNRLHTEWQRLYLPAPTAGAEPGAMIDTAGRVRALVMALRGPPSWELLSRVWQGVQAELALPAPAIAVSGTDSLQLWFAMAEPVGVPQAQAFLEALRVRFLDDVDAQRVVLMPAADGAGAHAAPVPACQADGNWSAFVAPDLAPVFAETPWLDIPPGDEGQATLLRGLRPITPAEYETAWERLRQTAAAPAPATHASIDGPAALPPPALPEAASTDLDPRRFLQRVVNDESVALALRIEAAKALLQHPPADMPP